MMCCRSSSSIPTTWSKWPLWRSVSDCFTCTHANSCTHTFTQARMHALTHMHAPEHLFTFLHTHAHTNTMVRQFEMLCRVTVTKGKKSMSHTGVLLAYWQLNLRVNISCLFSFLSSSVLLSIPFLGP